MNRLRAGFTLVEMLVATLIFVIGFMSVYALFITAVKYRQEADAITRSSVAASNMLSEMRLGLLSPYLHNPGPGALPEAGQPPIEFHAYEGMPGLFYHIDAPRQNANNDSRHIGGAIKVSLQFVQLSIPQATLDEATLRRRFRRSGDGPNGPEIAELVRRGVIQSYPAVIYPR